MFSFPDPSLNNEFSLGDKKWRWNGSYWELVKNVVAEGIRYYQQDDQPTDARIGDRWLNTKNLTEYVYVQMHDDPVTLEWIDLTGDYPGDTLVGD